MKTQIRSAAQAIAWLESLKDTYCVELTMEPPKYGFPGTVQIIIRTADLMPQNRMMYATVRKESVLAAAKAAQEEFFKKMEQLTGPVVEPELLVPCNFSLMDDADDRRRAEMRENAIKAGKAWPFTM